MFTDGFVFHLRAPFATAGDHPAWTDCSVRSEPFSKPLAAT